MQAQTRHRIIRIAFAVSIAALVNKLHLDFIESYLYDFRVRFSPSPEISQEITVVPITTSTVQALNGVPQLSDHTKILKKLKAYSPQSIAYFVSPAEITGDSLDRKEFVQEAQTLPLYISTQKLSMKGAKQETQLPAPLDQLTVWPGPRTTDKSLFAKDGVTRRALYSYQGQPLLQVKLAADKNPALTDPEQVQGLWAFLDSQQIYVHYAQKGSFRQIPFEKILSGDFNPDDFKNKIVLIGNDLGKSIKNYVLTPYSRSIENGMSILELNANVIDTLIRNSAPIPSPYWLNVLLTFIISIATVYIVLTIRPLNGLLILFGLFTILASASYLAYWPFDVWLKISHSIVAIFICYYFFIPYRLIRESRRSWEYYQKNKLLTKVEELKDNFISMMSHDLKTPLARIQGMVDVIQSDQKVELSQQQNQAIQTIHESSQELTDFIESILNFGRIESHGVKLQVKSQDINQLIDECVRKLDFKSKARNTEIICELEPLFSIKIDPTLTRQILMNLIENAIKYSPKNTKVLITSEEIEDFVVIQVADQGKGISPEDLDSIFMKFFRSKEAKISPVKGSGLGLYLSQYFAQLQKGKITVESQLGQGSTFSLYLPK